MKFRRFLTQNLLFFLLGLIVFSPMSSFILMDILHFPLTLPELLFVPFCFFLKDKIASIKIRVSDIIFAAIIIFILLVFGIAYGSFELYAMLSGSRPWFYLILTTLLFSKTNLINNNDIFYLSLGSIIAWLFISLLNFKKYLVGAVFTDEELCTFGVMIAVPLFIAYAMSSGKSLFLLVGMAALLPTCIFSGIRRLMVVVAFALVVSFFLSLKKNVKKFTKYVLLGFLIVIILIPVMPVIKDIVNDVSPTLYYRVFGRTETLLETGESQSAGDELRKKNIIKFFENIEEFTLPRGMVSLHTGTDRFAGLFNDFPLVQLSWLFGWPLAFFIVLYFLMILFKNYHKFKILKDDTSFISVVCLLTMFMLLFLEGTFLEYPESTPVTGIALGRAILNSKRNYLIE